MISIVNNKALDPNKALALYNLSRKKNRKGLIHDRIRAFFVQNLGLIHEGLEFIEKELRVVGGDIDIVAKKGQIFYLIEIKTRLAKYPKPEKDQVDQLLRQLNGLKHIISMFTDSQTSIELIIVEYVRDKEELVIKYLNSLGSITSVKKMNLKVD